LLNFEAKAKAAKIGIWKDDKKKSIRAVRYRDNATPEEQFAFFEKLKGKPCSGTFFLTSPSFLVSGHFSRLLLFE
jgi:hypothetical protein